MNVSRLARRAGTTSDTVRHYTDLGILRPRRNPDNGYRQYSQDDFRRLEFVLQARQLGFTLEDIQEIINESESGASPCAHVRQLIEERLEDVEARIEALSRLSQRMRRAMAEWTVQPDSPADGEHICGLIESFEETG